MDYRMMLAICVALGTLSVRAAEPAGTGQGQGSRPPAPIVGPVFIAAYVDVRPALARETGALVAGYIHATAADAGNVEARALEEVDRSGSFMIIETWKDEKAFNEHEKLPHTQEFRDKLKPISRVPFNQGVHSALNVDPMPAKSGSGDLYIVTHVDIRGGRESGEGSLKQLADAARADPGHVRYDAWQQAGNRTNHFTLFAIWKDRRSFDAFGATSHWLQFIATMAPLIGAPYEDRLYKPLR